MLADCSLVRLGGVLTGTEHHQALGRTNSNKRLSECGVNQFSEGKVLCLNDLCVIQRTASAFRHNHQTPHTAHKKGWGATIKQGDDVLFQRISIELG